MARPTIEQVRGLSDFQTLYRWNVTFASLPAKLVGSAPSIDDLNLRCETSEMPKMTNQAIPISVRGHKIKMPGISDYSQTITLTFVETVDAKIKSFLKAWREAIWASKTGVWAGTKAELQATILLEQLNNQDQAVWQFKLVGCFLEDYDLGQLAADQSDIQRPSMVLGYDYFEDGPSAV
jgi:hypothetical protein